MKMFERMRNVLSFVAACAVGLLVFLILQSTVHAAALSDNRDTAEMSGNYLITLQGSNVIYAGAMVAIDGTAVAVAASDTSGLSVIGRAETKSDNSGANYSATRYIKIKKGIFRWTNSGSFDNSHVGDLAYVADDASVCAASGATYDIIAGSIVYVDSTGVWVDTHDIGSQGAGSVSTLNASDAVTFLSTLAVDGVATVGALTTTGAVAATKASTFAAGITVDGTVTAGAISTTGTAALVGVATFTAESVHNGGLDTDYVTTDAAAGVDTKTAGTLKLGEATATKVEIADTGVSTDVEGPLVAKEDVQSNELDAETATALLIGKATATSVVLGASDINVSVAGTFTAPVVTPVAEATTARVCTSADYGKVLVVSSNAAVAVTLPANGAAAGSWIDFMVAGSDDCVPTVSAATTDTLIGPNDVDLKSVTYGSGHRIGAYLRVVSDGSFWHAINLGSTTMTGND